MSHTTTRIYIDTRTEPDTGISTGDIAYVLGRDTDDVGQLCGDKKWDEDEEEWVDANAIRSWSKHKPVRRTGLDNNFHPVMSDNDFKIVNYGFDLGVINTSQHTGAKTNDINELMSEAVYHSGDWTYLKPRGIWPTEPYSISDFNNYNHAAPEPYMAGAPTRPYEPGNKIVDIHEEPDAEIKMTDLATSVWGDSVPSLDNVYLYVMWRKVLPISGALNVILPITGDVTPITALSGAQGHSINFQIPMTSNGTYQFVAVATPWDAESGDDKDEYEWVWLPGTYMQVVINDQTHMLDCRYASQDIEADFSASINNLSFLQFFADVREWNIGLGDVADNVTFHFELSYGASISQITDIIYADDISGYSVDEGDQDNDHLEIQRSIDVSEAVNQYGANAMSHLFVRLWYEYTTESESLYFYHRYFDFLDTSGTSHAYADISTHSDIPRVAIQDILDIIQ